MEKDLFDMGEGDFEMNDYCSCMQIPLSYRIFKMGLGLEKWAGMGQDGSESIGPKYENQSPGYSMCNVPKTHKIVKTHTKTKNTSKVIIYLVKGQPN